MKYILILFAFIKNGFAYDLLVKHYDDRRATYDRHEAVDTHTIAINNILSAEDLINPNLHDERKKKKVIQTVMASVIIHERAYNLSALLPQPIKNPLFENHFEILKLTEKISLSLVIRGKFDLADFIKLQEYSGIKKSTFFSWFEEVCSDHNMHSIIQKIKEKEKYHKNELTLLRTELEKIKSLEEQINRNTLAQHPHHYDGSIKGWATELWATFTNLIPPQEIPSADSVEREIMMAAQANNLEGLITDRYNHLRSAGFEDTQNLLQRIVGWSIKNHGSDYTLLVLSLEPVSGSTNSAMYNVFLQPAINVVLNLYEKKNSIYRTRIKQII